MLEVLWASWRSVEEFHLALGRSVGRRNKEHKIVGLEKKQLMWSGSH